MSANRRPLWIVLALSLGLMVAFTSTALAGHTVRDAVYVKGDDVSVTVGSEPYAVTVGNDVAFFVNISDRGTKAAHGLTLTDTIPAGTSLVAVVPDQGTCVVSTNTIVCSLGDLPSGGRTTVRVITTTPSTQQILGDKATVAVSSPNDPNKSNNKTTGYTQTQTPYPDEVDGYVPPAGGVVSLPHHTSVAHPTSAAVKGSHTTDGFPVEMYVYDNDYYGYCQISQHCFGQIVEIDGLEGLTTAHPATVTLRYDPSEIPGSHTVTHTRLFDHGEVVPHCFGSAGKSAAPNPCVVSRSVLANGDWKIVVRTAEQYAVFQL